MTTIASFQHVTYADSLHILDLEAGDKNYNRRPKIHILNEWAAYAVCGSSIFPPAIQLAIENELRRLADIIIAKGYANHKDLGSIVDIAADESHFLLILADSRWVIQKDKLIFIPENSDVVLGTGAPHHNSIRFLIPKEEPELIMAKIALLDDGTRGPWVRFKHDQLKSKVMEK